MKPRKSIPHIEFRKECGIFGIYVNGEYVGDFVRWECDLNRNPIGFAKNFIDILENLKMYVSDNVVDVLKYLDSQSEAQQKEGGNE